MICKAPSTTSDNAGLTRTLSQQAAQWALLAASRRRTNGFENPASQAQEVADRTTADTRWLQAAFKLAIASKAKAVVIALQADMWDPAAIAPGGDGLSAYTSFVQHLANF